MITRATDPAQLSDVIDIIHDEWFEVSDIRYDREERRVRIPFTRDRESERWILEVADVDSLLIEESEGIGKYDFNKLSYASDTGRLTVETGIPLNVQMTVSRLDVSVYLGSPS